MKKIFPKNKKGDIPTTLLVIGVIALCGLAIFIFVNSLNKAKDSFDYIDEVEKATTEIEKDSLGEYSDKVKETQMKLNFRDWKEERVVFSIDYSSP